VKGLGDAASVAGILSPNARDHVCRICLPIGHAQECTALPIAPAECVGDAVLIWLAALLAISGGLRLKALRALSS
jgi:hypothetical protein